LIRLSHHIGKFVQESHDRLYLQGRSFEFEDLAGRIALDQMAERMAVALAAALAYQASDPVVTAIQELDLVAYFAWVSDQAACFTWAFNLVASFQVACFAWASDLMKSSQSAWAFDLVASSQAATCLAIVQIRTGLAATRSYQVATKPYLVAAESYRVAIPESSRDVPSQVLSHQDSTS